MVAGLALVHRQRCSFVRGRIEQQPQAQRTATAGAPVRCCRRRHSTCLLIAVHGGLETAFCAYTARNQPETRKTSSSNPTASQNRTV
jgi:hypothetical protein